MLCSDNCFFFKSFVYWRESEEANESAPADSQMPIPSSPRFLWDCTLWQVSSPAITRNQTTIHHYLGPTESIRLVTAQEVWHLTTNHSPISTIAHHQRRAFSSTSCSSDKRKCFCLHRWVVAASFPPPERKLHDTSAEKRAGKIVADLSCAGNHLFERYSSVWQSVH